MKTNYIEVFFFYCTFFT